MPPIPDSVKNNPKLQYLKSRFEKTISLAIEKTAAHLKDPAHYPMPANNKNIESALLDFVKELPKKRQDKFLDKLKSKLDANTSQRQQYYGDLAAIDLKSRTPIAEQVKATPAPENMKIKQEELDEWIKKVKPASGKVFKKIIPGKKPQPQQASTGTTLQFSVESLTCEKNSEIGKDEISVSAFASDNIGTLQEKNAFFNDKFKKGQSKAIGAAGANIFSFLLDDSTGGTFPATFSAGVFLTESDLFHNVALGQKLAAIFGILGVTIGIIGIGLLFIPGVGPLLWLICTIVGGIFFIVGGQILPFFFDDISSVGSDDLLLEVPPNAGETFTRTVSMSLLNVDAIIGDLTKGSYTANIRWSVV